MNACTTHMHVCIGGDMNGMLSELVIGILKCVSVWLHACGDDAGGDTVWVSVNAS